MIEVLNKVLEFGFCWISKSGMGPHPIDWKNKSKYFKNETVVWFNKKKN